MRKREAIADIVSDDARPADLKKRLQLLQAARQFSIDELALPDNGSYRSYADIGREFVVWNVFAAPEFSLQPKQWCFPVAGCVSYRGYFSRAAALKAANRLQKKGFDVYVGGVSAYSTLGNFDDPVLSSMLRWDDTRLVGVLFHELAHQVLYLRGDSGFNESFATAVEERGVERWLESVGRQDDIASYWERRRFGEDLMALVADARDDLGRIYAKKIDDDQKRRLKVARFERLEVDVNALLQRPGDAASGRGDQFNNARLVSMILYEGRLPAFRTLLQQCTQDMRCFYAAATQLSTLQQADRDAALDALTGG